MSSSSNLISEALDTSVPAVLKKIEVLRSRVEYLKVKRNKLTVIFESKKEELARTNEILHSTQREEKRLDDIVLDVQQQYSEARTLSSQQSAMFRAMTKKRRQLQV